MLMNHNVIPHKTILRKTSNQKKKLWHSKAAKNHFSDGGDRCIKRLQIVFESTEQRVHKQKDTDT